MSFIYKNAKVAEIGGNRAWVLIRMMSDSGHKLFVDKENNTVNLKTAAAKEELKRLIAE